ncbi:hypothetical protein OIV83_004406 [Microbotryomycetes sp. JL201]|nr:hypothetical protein OIV83_004406 [Microbotryomycetes sp. JL201]
MGRRKISIAPIADDRNRSVTFLKRKNGLFKKAYELGVLCSADVAVIVFNNAGKLYEFHSGDMDQILLRYSHYSGPAYEKKGPEDFAAKNQAEMAKAGAGGKMTVNDHSLGDDDDDEVGSDDSLDEKPAAAKKNGKRAGKPMPASRGAQDGPSQRDASSFSQPSLPQYPNYNQQQPGQWPNQPTNGYSLPPALPGMPQRASTMPMVNPWLQPGAQPQNISQWAMQNLYSAAAAAAAGTAPNGNMQPIATSSYQLPPLGGVPDFGMLQQAYQQSQQPPPASAPFFPGLPNLPPAHSMYFGQQQQQQQQQQPPPQNSAQAHLAQHQGQLTSSPQSSSQRGTPDVDSVSRDDSDQSAAATPNTGRSREPPSRSDSLNANKPKLSVNIPPDESGAQNGQAPALHATGTSQMQDDDGSRTAHPLHQQSARFATDLLPSPSGFLNDVIYASGVPYSSMSGLNTAIAMTNGDDGRQVFQWPVMQQQQQQHQQQQQTQSSATSVPKSDIRDDRLNESAERFSAKRRSTTDDMSIDGERPPSAASSNASKRSKHS